MKTESEAYILGWMMLDGDLVPEALSSLSREMFSSDHGTVFEAIRSLSETKTPVDVVTVFSKLDSLGVLGEVEMTLRYLCAPCNRKPLHFFYRLVRWVLCYKKRLFFNLL